MAADTPAPSPPVKRPLYEGSTQYQNWRFSPERLAEIRISLNKMAVDVIRQTFETDSPGSSNDVEFLNADEEYLLVKLYISKISQLCRHFQFPEEVEATAASYLKRFYLKNTVMDWHPKNVMLTALFLATKTTNNPIKLEDFTSRIPNTNSSDILDLEFLIAQSLRFEFAVWHAHRALWGMWLDLQSVSQSEQPQEVYDVALNHVRASRLTDAELIHTPSQIALACLSLASPDLATEWAKAKLPVDSPAYAALQSAVEAIKSLVTLSSLTPDVESVRAVDRRLKLCKNPEKVVGSNVYLAKKAEEEKKAMEKMMRKAEKAKKAMEEGDPFGDILQQKAKPEALDDDDEE